MRKPAGLQPSPTLLVACVGLCLALALYRERGREGVEPRNAATSAETKGGRVPVPQIVGGQSTTIQQ